MRLGSFFLSPPLPLLAELSCLLGRNCTSPADGGSGELSASVTISLRSYRMAMRRLNMSATCGRGMVYMFGK